MPRAFERMAQAFDLLVNRPSYVLGRFQCVRGVFSGAQRMRQGLKGRPALRIGDLHQKCDTPLTVAPSHCIATAPSAAEHLKDLSRHAYSAGLTLAPAACESLLRAGKDMSLTTVPLGNVITLNALNAAPDIRKRVATARVLDSAQLGAVQAIAADPIILDVVSSYLGYFPGEVTSYFFWSFANGMDDAERARVQTTRFHYDVYGYNFVYVSFYLTPTDAQSGAHALIEGSHRKKRLGRLLGSARISDAQAAKDYGAERVKVIEGDAGTGFFEDTSCYHKALAPVTQDRLMLQLRYQ